MPIWLTAMCPQALIVTLGDVSESCNAKNRVNLACSVCARCGDEVLCGAENAVFGRVQTSACERAKNCAQMDPNRLTCLIGHWNRGLSSKINSPLPSRSTLARSLPCARSHMRSHAHAPMCTLPQTLLARSCRPMLVFMDRHPPASAHSALPVSAHCTLLHSASVHHPLIVLPSVLLSSTDQ